MRCPKCGNEVGPEEVFCGQCGTPMMPLAQPTEMVQSTPSLNGLRSGYTRPVPPSSNMYNTGMVSPSTGSASPNPLTTRQLGPQQQDNFYRDATEAMTALPPRQSMQPGQPIQNYPTQYPPQNLASMQSGYPGTGQFGTQQQPFQQGGYAPPGYIPPQPFPPGQGYARSTKLTPPPQKQRNYLPLIVACICLAVALLTVIGFGVLYLTSHSSPKATSAPTVTTAPTATPIASPTPSLSPTPNASPSSTASSVPTDTPTAIPSPSPTAIPTPTPDANFSWCQGCSSNGFSVEFPNGWAQGSTPDGTGVLFQDQLNTQEYAAFKTPGAITSNTTASDLVNTDLQNSFASKPGYIPPSSQSTTTIGGENWNYAIAYYRSNNQKIRVEVFATVHKGKAYIIELQALDSQFDSENAKYFEVMLSRFQFE